MKNLAYKKYIHKTQNNFEGQVPIKLNLPSSVQDDGRRTSGKYIAWSTDAPQAMNFRLFGPLQKRIFSAWSAENLADPW